MSTEITGYALSAFVYLHHLSQDTRYLDAAGRAARFLTRQAWDPATRAMPFETAPAAYAYFFDCGIIVRGLLAYWHAAREQEALEIAVAIGEMMLRDFAAPAGDFHPILALPSKAAPGARCHTLVALPGLLSAQIRHGMVGPVRGYRRGALSRTL